MRSTTSQQQLVVVGCCTWSAVWPQGVARDHPYHSPAQACVQALRIAAGCRVQHQEGFARGACVTFTCRTRHEEADGARPGIQQMTVPVADLLQRWLLHVPMPQTQCVFYSLKAAAQAR